MIGVDEELGALAEWIENAQAELIDAVAERRRELVPGYGTAPVDAFAPNGLGLIT